MNYKTENMLKLIFEEKLASTLNSVQCEEINIISEKFKAIFVDDCTATNLPVKLAKYFPWNVSRGEKKSVAKIHALYNFTKTIFHFLTSTVLLIMTKVFHPMSSPT